MSRSMMLGAGCAALFIAAFVGILVTVDGWGDALIGIDQWWNGLMVASRGDVLVGAATLFGRIGGGWLAIAFVPLSVIAVLLFLQRFRAAVFFALSSALCALGVQVLKSLYARDRPAEILVAADFGSFPSGHTANAVVIAVALAIIFPRALVVIVGVSWAVLMGFSRTVLSAHWLTDVFGGALVGAGATFLLAAFMLPWIRKDTEPPPDRVD